MARINPINLDRTFTAEEVCEALDKMEAVARRGFLACAAGGVAIGALLGIIVASVAFLNA